MKLEIALRRSAITCAAAVLRILRGNIAGPVGSIMSEMHISVVD